MRRREFITLLGGAAAGWPFAARAQQAERLRRIGVLIGIAGNDAETKVRIAALSQELQRLGWVEGRENMRQKNWLVPRLARYWARRSRWLRL
jgi:putative ABC transport system substrate-binding protein